LDASGFRELAAQIAAEAAKLSDAGHDATLFREGRQRKVKGLDTF
jgi:hypothetical protein